MFNKFMLAPLIAQVFLLISFTMTQLFNVDKNGSSNSGRTVLFSRKGSHCRQLCLIFLSPSLSPQLKALSLPPPLPFSCQGGAREGGGPPAGGRGGAGSAEASSASATVDSSTLAH